MFTASFAYQLPFGAGHSLNPGNAVARALVSGWTVSGIVTFTTGSPLALVGTACTSGDILGTCIPSYNPAFSGDVRINGNYGDGNVLGSSPTSYLNRSRVRRARGVYRRQHAEDRRLRSERAVQLLH